MGDRSERRKIAAALGTVGATALGSWLMLVGAAGAAIRPEPGQEVVERAAMRLARAIAENPRDIHSADFALLPPGGNPAAVSTTRLAGFPRHGPSYTILSNGDSRDADNRNTEPDTSTRLNGPFLRGARDAVILRLKVRVERGENCLSIRFRFLSEEFPEFINSEFNDAFIAEAGSSSWQAPQSGEGGNQDPGIRAPGNFAQNAQGGLVSVNAAGNANVTARNARGTTYDGATPLLRASTRVRPGARSIYLSIFDQGDRDYDSAVFLDRMTINRQGNCESGAVAE